MNLARSSVNVDFNVRADLSIARGDENFLISHARKLLQEHPILSKIRVQV